MSVSDGVELAGLVVALIVGIPATMSAVIMIKGHFRSNYKQITGELRPIGNVRDWELVRGCLTNTKIS